LQYLNKVSAYFLPFLKDRVLTTIRFPNGMEQQSFYQKNCPEYAPSFVKTHMEDGIRYIVCQDLQTLLWLGNQAAIEYHVPFSEISSDNPSEIVFDLDPPSREDFQLAVEAATILKDILDRLQLVSFVKTSGNKGLQVYIPLQKNTFTYEQTRKFTSFVAEYLVQKEPRWFTIERLKEKRGNKLYVDYVQHAKGKTIIAPYSPRGNEGALVATPLRWEEVTGKLRPELFSIDTVLHRLGTKGCPFSAFFRKREGEQFLKIINNLE
jgi:bifunctional non-homologous end joining protein LigD